ncbi:MULTISPECIES: enoyl-CoA hydratase/isomerase family protein [unclassified Caballeronia]|uniref:enoyl-CoA hydratase/isomerase family protein n=1 Tax=unclassified Caballeronia TaxID=2646786 RepID=UPI00285623EA|nr:MULTISPECIES: enoyl-CoA hydratase/isomerase family protein [unclassified Caballeronia]MDR5749326.1 enoyl-CoA hydratase/isomerase family protein [Caballeronia sp. LZ024]MDR5843543.1 enoyl-CoA hydratase/isomerase family protein [Caballeronia sp. LZ031]
MTDALNLQRLQFAVEGHVARVTLDRSDVRNAFDDATIVELTAAFRALDDDTSVRAIVLAANGPAFCAGADLNWMKRMAGYSDAENRADALGLATMLNTIYTCRKPVIARVQGDAYAGGMGLVAACDMAISADSANFCLSEAKLGLMPATIAPYVIRAMGARAAHRYFVTAERFDAAEALRIGFVHQVVAADQLDAAVNAVAASIVANSPNAVRECKQLVVDLAERAIDGTLITDTADRIARIRASDEGREGVRSFLEKRKPSWLA